MLPQRFIITLWPNNTPELFFLLDSWSWELLLSSTSLHCMSHFFHSSPVSYTSPGKVHVSLPYNCSSAEEGCQRQAGFRPLAQRSSKPLSEAPHSVRLHFWNKLTRFQLSNYSIQFRWRCSSDLARACFIWDIYKIRCRKALLPTGSRSVG